MSIIEIRKAKGIHKKAVVKRMLEEQKPGVCVKEWLIDEEITPARIAEFPGVIVLEPMQKADLELIAVLLNKPVWYIPNRPEITELVQQIAQTIKSKLEPSISYPNVQPRQIIKKAC